MQNSSNFTLVIVVVVLVEVNYFRGQDILPIPGNWFATSMLDNENYTQHIWKVPGYKRLGYFILRCRSPLQLE